MGNLTGDPFIPGVKQQIDIRQRRLGRTNRGSDDLVFYNSSTAFLRLASSIDVDAPLGPDGNPNPDLPLEKLPFLTPTTDYIGDKLAKKCILFGGVVDISSPTSDPRLNFGFNFTAEDGILDGAYGWGSVYPGFKPMPSVTSADISYYNRGAIAKATIKIQVNSIRQLEIIDVLYNRVGYTMLLEWGHTIYFDNANNLQTFRDFNTIPLQKFFTPGTTQKDMTDYIKQEREKHSYNYDGMLGKVVNFKWDYTDQGYAVELSLIGMGDIVEALKINKGTGAGPTDPNALSDAAKTKAEDASAAAEAANSALSDFYSDRKNKYQFGFDIDAVLEQIFPGNASNKFSTSQAFLTSNASSHVNNILAIAAYLKDTTGTNTTAASVRTALSTGDPNRLNAAIGLNANANIQGVKKTNADGTETYVDKYSVGTSLEQYANQLKSKVNTAVSKASAAKAAESGVNQAKITESNAIVQSANRCSLTKWMYDNIYSKDQAAATTAIGAYAAGFKDPVLKIGYKKSEGKAEYKFGQGYLKLGVLLNFVRNELMVYDSTKTNAPSDQQATSYLVDGKSGGLNIGVPFIDIDLDRENTLCLSFPNQMSGNPEICLIPFRYYPPDALKNKDFIDSTTPYTLYDLGLPGIDQNDTGFLVKDNPYKGRPLDIYLNINHITQCIDSSTDQYGKTALLPFLKAVINGVNIALGGVNRLSVGFDGEEMSLKIIEEHNIRRSEIDEGGDISTFNVYGLPSAPSPNSAPSTTPTAYDLWGSFVTGLNFSVKIPPNMAAMASISAQSSGNIVGENATGLSKLNKGLKDRIVAVKLDPASIGLAATGQENDPSLLFSKNLETQKKLLDNIYTKLTLDKENLTGLVDINKDIAFYITGYASEKNKMPPAFFLPFDLSLEMKGLSGMVNYQRFAVTENILPSTYQTSVIKDDTTQQKLTQGIVDFLVKGIGHTISDGKWTTKIESLSVISTRFSRKNV